MAKNKLSAAADASAAAGGVAMRFGSASRATGEGAGGPAEPTWVENVVYLPAVRGDPHPNPLPFDSPAASLRAGSGQGEGINQVLCQAIPSKGFQAVNSFRRPRDSGQGEGTTEFLRQVWFPLYFIPNFFRLRANP